MYKISEVKINQFWYRFDIKGVFKNDVNIIIGNNGTGKTTFMNILHSVLAVDVEGLYDYDFKSVEIVLLNEKKKKTIRATKIEREDSPFLYVEYQITNKKHMIRCFGRSDRDRVHSSYKRRAIEESYEVRRELASIVSLASLSVYRIQSEKDYDSRDRMIKRIISPVDNTLSELMARLTKYQLELSQEARLTSSELQKNVLVSLLYAKDSENNDMIALDFNKEQERSKLINAYNQLNVMDAAVRSRIKKHVEAIEKAAIQFKEYKDTKHPESVDIDFSAFEAYGRTRNIVEMSLAAEKVTDKIFKQVNVFISILKEFISNKNFSFDAGDLIIQNEDGAIPYTKLSSGEKQLLILLTEALLQKEMPFVFLADEPELSLHISWQKMIVPAIRRLNPNAQIIVATHSPEIAGNYKDAIIDMESMLHA